MREKFEKVVYNSTDYIKNAYMMVKTQNHGKEIELEEMLDMMSPLIETHEKHEHENARSESNFVVDEERKRKKKEKKNRKQLSAKPKRHWRYAPPQRALTVVRVTLLAFVCFFRTASVSGAGRAVISTSSSSRTKSRGCRPT